MNNRILVPQNATLGAEGAAPPGTRRKTALDTRTVIAADLPAGQIDATSNIPAYMPLDVLSARLIIPRDMPVNALDVGHLPSHVPLEVLGEHVAVPKDAVLPQTPAVRQPMQHAAEMPEVLDPDVLTTGEVHLMTDGPRSLRDERNGFCAARRPCCTPRPCNSAADSEFVYSAPTTPDGNDLQRRILWAIFICRRICAARCVLLRHIDPGSESDSHRSKNNSAVDAVGPGAYTAAESPKYLRR